MTEHLLDGVEAVDQREILNHLAVFETHEMRESVADDAAIFGALGPEPVERGHLVAIDQNRARHEAEHLENFRASTGPLMVHSTSSPTNCATVSTSRSA